VHDTATLAGLTGSTFTGDTVTDTVYPSPNACTAGTGGTSIGSVPVSGNGLQVTGRGTACGAS
jgi:hypothetical protein